MLIMFFAPFDTAKVQQFLDMTKLLNVFNLILKDY